MRFNISVQIIHPTTLSACPMRKRQIICANCDLPAATAATSRNVLGLVFALAIVPDLVESNRIALLAVLELWIVLDMGKAIITAVIWCNKTEAFVLEEFLHCSFFRHAQFVDSCTHKIANCNKATL